MGIQRLARVVWGGFFILGILMFFGGTISFIQNVYFYSPECSNTLRCETIADVMNHYLRYLISSFLMFWPQLAIVLLGAFIVAITETAIAILRMARRVDEIDVHLNLLRIEKDNSYFNS